MTGAVAADRRTPTLGELLSGLDASIPRERVLLDPWPGTATPADIEAIHDRERRLCELIDGTLVEKTMGSPESNLAARLIYLIMCFTEPRNLGEVLAPDGPIRFGPKLVLLPDVAFFARERLPGGVFPKQAVIDIIPDLAVEVLSPSNTRAEMDRKLKEYFDAGVRLVWYAEPKKREVRAFEAVDRFVVLGPDEVFDGGAVLPGFALRVGDWLR